MALPILLAGIALGTTIYGAKKGYDGYQKKSEADEIIDAAKVSYEKARASFEKQEKETQSALSQLGETELEIGKSFDEFKTLADELLEQLNKGRQSKLEFRVPQHQLQKIEQYSYTALGVLGAVAGAGAAGAAAGFAVYGGVMTLGAASTGTAISALSGAAATKATLAAIGGGSLASGGLGIAGGTAILGAAVAGPILAIAGWAYDSHGTEALKKATAIRAEMGHALLKLSKAVKMLKDAEDYACKVRRALSAIYRQFNRYYFSLQDIEKYINDIKGRGVDVSAEISKFGESILKTVENGYALAAILTDIIKTPIFKMKEANGRVDIGKDGIPEIKLDADGLMVVNKQGLDQAMKIGAESAEKYQR